MTMSTDDEERRRSVHQPHLSIFLLQSGGTTKCTDGWKWLAKRVSSWMLISILLSDIVLSLLSAVGNHGIMAGEFVDGQTIGQLTGEFVDGQTFGHITGEFVNGQTLGGLQTDEIIVPEINKLSVRR